MNNADAASPESTRSAGRADQRSVSRSVRRVVGYAYSWDVIGDPAFADRTLGLGIDEVSLAATYHGTRAATPLHPQHRLVEAPQAALYRPVRESAWSGKALRPVTADWVDSADPFGQPAGLLTARSIRVHAWVVLAHSSRLGSLRPDLAVQNCFGDTYSYALCPSHDEVRDYASTLAAEAVRGVAVDGVCVEGCGQMGIAHNGVHEKTDGAYGPAAQRILSVCCCAGCHSAWAASGWASREVVGRLRTALAAVQDGSMASDAPVSLALGDELAAALLGARWSAQNAVRTAVFAALREVAPDARITLHGQPDSWATGPSPAVSAAAAGAVDSILVPAWAPVTTTYEAVAATRRLAPDSVSIGAYVTVLPPADLETAGPHARAVVAAGADELHLYHLGIANRAQLDVLGRLAAEGR